ncbi:MAG: pyridoxamine 5'-phosphate oxidase family protein [Dehalococcoidia bacterium]
MDERVRAFLEANHAAAMVTLRADGTPHAARIGVALVGDQLWSSGTQERLRTRFLRRDPRCTLFVFPSGEDEEPQYLTLETRVTLLEGDEVPDLSIQLFRAMQPGTPEGTVLWGGQPRTYDEFRQQMRDDHRLIYQFEVERTYGLF